MGHKKCFNEKKNSLFLATEFKILGGFCLKKRNCLRLWGGQNFFTFLDDSEHVNKKKLGKLGPNRKALPPLLGRIP